MIINWLFDLFYWIADLFMNVLPDIELPLTFSDYVGAVANVVGYLDTFISLPVVILCISTILIIDNFAIIIRLAAWVWSLLPFS